jgi:lycopene cyclase domain-containing protein
MLGLPPGEYLFFITVPFACLFIWQIIVTNRPAGTNRFRSWMMPAAAGIFLAAAAGMLVYGKMYTAIVCFMIAFTIIFDKLSDCRLLDQKRICWYLAVLTGLILLFNGYLTARPVVLYNTRFILNLRVGTIPVEDFGYGYTLILLCTMLFEKFKGSCNE